MGRAHASRFWRETARYHDLARGFERNIDVTHPDYVTTDRLCRWARWCKWHRTSVVYREYRGPKPLTA